MDDFKKIIEDSQALKKAIKDIETRGSDMLFIITEEQADTLEELLLDILTDKTPEITTRDKRVLLEVLQYIQS